MRYHLAVTCMAVGFALVFPKGDLAAAEHIRTTPQGIALIEESELLAPFTKGEDKTPVIVQLRSAMHKAFDARDWNNKSRTAELIAETKRASAQVLSRLPKGGHQLRHTYGSFAGFAAEVTSDTLATLLADPDVLSIEPSSPVEMHSDKQALPLMNALNSRPQYSGAGVSVAVVDTGIDYNHPFLGNGGFPNSKVIGGYDVADGDADPAPSNVSASTGHGTACAGIVAGSVGQSGDYIGGVAPDAKLYALKITRSASASQGASDADIIAAWDWCVTHKNDDPKNPILVVSTSFGGGRYTGSCDGVSSGYVSVLNNGRNAGISFFVSSGNNGYCGAVCEPSCLSGVISVGGVYDTDAGGLLGYCVSSESCVPAHPTFDCGSPSYKAVGAVYRRDAVAEYSNSSGLLTLLAPSNDASTLDIVGAPGYTANEWNGYFGGTSAACPYAAGAAAVLQSAAFAKMGRYLTPDEVRSTLLSTGAPVTDGRNGQVTPRVDVGAAINALGPSPVPTNDDFANAFPLTGTEGIASLNNVSATREAGEPDHGAGVDDKTVWWKFTAPRDGNLSVTTQHSNFDTVLAIYSGTTLQELSPIASNDNAPGSDTWSTVRVEVVGGQQVWIAVTGAAGSSGNIDLGYKFEASTCFRSSLVSSNSAVDLSVGATSAVKVKATAQGFQVKGLLSVHQQEIGQNGALTRGIPEHRVRLYVMDTPVIPCSFNESPLAAYTVKAGKVAKSGREAKPARVRVSFVSEAPVTGKYLLAVLDPENAILEQDKQNNTLLLGPMP